MIGYVDVVGCTIPAGRYIKNEDYTMELLMYMALIMLVQATTIYGLEKAGGEYDKEDGADGNSTEMGTGMFSRGWVCH
jgi:hypothetical protein